MCLPVSDYILVPPCSLNVAVLLDVWDSTSRDTHHLQGVCVQRARHVEPEEYLHVSDLRSEGGRAPLHAPHQLSLQVVEPLEVVLSEGLRCTPLDHVAPENHVDAIRVPKYLHVT